MDTMICAMLAMAVQGSDHKIDTHQDRASTVKVTISGDIDLEYLFRDRTLSASRGSYGSYGGGAGADGRGEGVIQAGAGVRLDVDLTESVRIILSLHNKRFEAAGAPPDPTPDILGRNPEGVQMLVDEASITLNELFTPGLSLSLGVVPVTFDVRGKGSAFFFDPANSGSLFGNARSSVSGGNGQPTSEKDNLSPTGMHAVYAKETLSAGLFLLPAVIEGGSAKADESAYGLWFMTHVPSLGSGSRLGALICVAGGNEGTGSDSSLFTLGVGGDLRGWVPGLELYGEFYRQFGNVGSIAGETLHAGGWALQAGGEYHLPDGGINPWFGLNLTFFSGDSDQSAGDTRVDAFLSYENVNDLMILEDQFFGMDIDTNYWAVKPQAGCALTVGSGALKNNLALSLSMGFAKCAKSIDFGAAGKKDDLGFEMDLKCAYSLSKQATVKLGAGALFGSDVLEQSLGGSGDPDASKRAFVWSLGVDARF